MNQSRDSEDVFSKVEKRQNWIDKMERQGEKDTSGIRRSLARRKISRLSKFHSKMGQSDMKTLVG